MLSVPKQSRQKLAPAVRAPLLNIGIYVVSLSVCENGQNCFSLAVSRKFDDCKETVGKAAKRLSKVKAEKRVCKTCSFASARPHKPKTMSL